jgi:hypothetical protein
MVIKRGKVRTQAEGKRDKVIAMIGFAGAPKQSMLRTTPKSSHDCEE